MHVCKISSLTKRSHLKTTKKILRYLKHTQNVDLWYPKGAKFELVGYSDLDYAGCKVERKSTSGTVSKKQNSVALSIAKAKYISTGSCCAQILWMKTTLNDFGISSRECHCYVTMRVQSN